MAKKVCYIGHGYHSRTRSTNFFVDLLEDLFGEVDKFADDTYLGHTFDKIGEINASDYELIVVFQSERVAKDLVEAGVSARLLFIPMYDGCRQVPDSYWQSFVGKKNVLVFSFSSTLHFQLCQWGVRSARFQYFPDFEQKFELYKKTERNAFLWCRTSVPSLDTVHALLGSNNIDNIHFHIANDPNHSISEENVREKFKNYNVTTSTWFDDPDDYKKMLRSTTLYFAPREFEGIGMSFLEAFGHGCAVVAANNPTMNEYIVDGVNGYLYDPENPKELHLSDIDSVCNQARKTAVNGRIQWERDCHTRMTALLHDFDLADTVDAQEYALWYWSEHEIQDDSKKGSRSIATTSQYPSVTVAVVCRNAEDVVEHTLRTVVSQSYENYEVVVVDGLSTDSTVDIVNKYSSCITTFVSEADNGPYDAMTKAAILGSGEYIIYINAGDYFADHTALETAIKNVFDDEVNRLVPPDFIVGNHIYVHDCGISNLHFARRFEDTWSELISGDLSDSWWGGIPCHQATFTRRSLLEESNGYSKSFQIAADHEFMFRNMSQGKKFVHCNHTISVYVGGGLSSVEVEKCGNESWNIAKTYGDSDCIKPYYLRVFGVEAIYQIPEHTHQEIKDVRNSGVFWEDWYRLHYLPKGLEDLDPIAHFLIEGRMAGAMPNPCFNPDHYYAINKDVPRERFDPLVHYVRNGIDEMRSTLDWSNKTQEGAFLSRMFNPFEKSLVELDGEILNYTHEELVSFVRSE